MIGINFCRVVSLVEWVDDDKGSLAFRQGISVFHVEAFATVARLSEPIALSAQRAERHCPA